MKIVSFPPIADISSKVLILGTMPGLKSLSADQYYAHAGNQFWKIMFELFGEPFTKNYEVRKKLLLKNNIALWDVLQGCIRTGSSDSNILDEVCNDFNSFFSQHPLIKVVFFTSKKTQEYFSRHVQAPHYITTILLPSTSSANGWKTYEEKLAEWAVVRKVVNGEITI
jgi:hypoxanthine-DNA glycosylase